KEVTELGLKYNLLTQYTSFVAIDSEARNENGIPTTVVQPLPLPDGVSNLAVQSSGGAMGYAPRRRYKMAEKVDMSLRAAEYEVKRMEKEVSSSELAGVSSDKDESIEESPSIIYNSAEKMPTFVGGQPALEAYLKKHLNLTTTEQSKWAGIKLKVSFVVDIDGSLEDVQVKGCKDNALRMRILQLFRKMPAWNAGENTGGKVKVRMEIPMTIA
ncbi:MAG: hypothetical protein QF371_09910, partial [Flavobacteriales bacterium]|nr:hypothetical protein [Flavobacteriales bacterium]